MDGQEYLNQIAAQARPEKQSKMGGLLSSPIAKVAAIGVALLILIMIVGSMLGGGQENVQTQATQLLLHINNTAAAVSEYQGNLKSSALRSSSASLGSVLSNTSRDLNEYMVAKYKYRENSQANKELAAAAALHQDGLTSELFNAKINGILDRIYAHKMAYEISLITGEESRLYNKTRDENLRRVIESSYESLENLYTQFDEFSETK